MIVASPLAAHGFEESHVDFNGDGFDDLVINTPGKTVDGYASAGEITVMYGSSTGVQPSTSVTFTEDTPGVPESAHARDNWGYTHAVGDFNHDGYDDLAIGGEDTVSAQDNAGTVTILWGSAQGLTATGSCSTSVPIHWRGAEGRFVVRRGTCGGRLRRRRL